MKKSAWCSKCDKLAEGWDQRTTKDGIRWLVRCHGEQYVREAPWGHLKHRAPAWYFEGLFKDSPIYWRKRAEARKGC